MRFPSLTSAITLCLVVACGTRPGVAPTAPELAATDQAIQSAMRASAEAWNRGDIDGHVAMYTDSATMMTRNGPITGRGTIEGLLARAFWRDGKPLQQLSFDDLVVRPLGRDYALLTGKFTLSGGGKPDVSGRYSLVWERTPAGWRIIHDHSG
ncbi:MAG TPA: nuclear transport factor 2 family protein [Gemmatimonadales bacterium]|nr:nuclear transport factor 2 family protein [Gemmatimonadales bacterium]